MTTVYKRKPRVYGIVEDFVINIDTSTLQPKLIETIDISIGSSGSVGDWAFDENSLYICIAENTWRKATLSEF